MIGENLLNISKINDHSFKITTDQFTYVYTALDKYSYLTDIKSFPDIIYTGEITKIIDDGNEFVIITDFGINKIELEMYSFGFGYFILLDKF